MVIKGTSCAGAARIAKHLSCTETNEHNELHELRGVAAEDLYGALREMEALVLGTSAKRPFYHASLNARADERLTDEQRAHAIDRLEAALGLSGQPRVVVIHHKRDCGYRLREHCHIVWSRIDVERMRVISDSHNYRKHEQVARNLEREFDHAHVQGAHIERDGQPRPKRTPSHAEMLQAERTGLNVQTVKAAVTDIWCRTDSGQAFAGALRDTGYVLARGDRRDFVVIDPKGGVHSLARHVEGAKAKDIRARMADLDPLRLPSVAEARCLQRARANSRSAPATAGLSKRQARIPTRVLRADAKRTRNFGRRSAVPKPPARHGPHRPYAGLSDHQNLSHTSALRETSKTLKPVGLTAPRDIAHSQIRPPGFYARLKQERDGADARHFAVGPAFGLAFPRAPPRLGAADEPIASPRSTPVSSQPASEAGDLRSTERGTSAPDYSDAENIELAQILSAIAEDVQRHCVAVCQGIEAQFAARLICARKTLPRSQIAGALAALIAERQAALAAARQQARIELFARSQAVKALYGRRPPRPSALPKAENGGRAQPT